VLWWPIKTLLNHEVIKCFSKSKVLIQHNWVKNKEKPVLHLQHWE
jgi:hypothetical protein